MKTVVHTADWHIRDYQYGRRFRGEDTKKAAIQVVEQAKALGASAILNSGDTLHTNRPSCTMLEALWELDRLLVQVNMPMYVVTGNHDKSDPSFLDFPAYGREGWNESGIVNIDFKTVQIPGTDVRVAGYPAIPGDEFLKRLNENPPEADFILWHGAVREFIGFPHPDAISLSDFPLGLCKGYLLGDIHVSECKRLEDGTLVAYPGSIELCDRGEAAEKSVDVYELYDEWRRLPLLDPMKLALQTRPVIYLQVADEPELNQAVERVQREISLHPDQSPLIFMRYSRTMAPQLSRIRSLLDLSQSVFRASPFGDKSATPQGVERSKIMPELKAVVAEIFAPGSELHGICCELCDKEVNHRAVLTDWTEKRIENVK